MGRQRENHNITLVGYDPGDSWCGCAALVLHNNRMSARAKVVDRRAQKISDTVDRMMTIGLPLGLATRIDIIEDFQARPVGFNSFSSMQTPRLIGALEYAIEGCGRTASFIPPGNADKELPDLTRGLFDMWHEAILPLPHWEHALSAWRVVFHYLMRWDVDLLKRMHSKKVRDSYREYRYPGSGTTKSEIVCGAAAWDIF